MNFYSLNKKATNVSFKDAVIKGIAPDRGLYFPEKITPLPKDLFENISSLSNTEIAFKAIHQFVSDDINDDKLKSILEEVMLPYLSPHLEIQAELSQMVF